MKYVITIGHGAYSGKNSLRMCFSKAQAVRVLQARGVSRNVALAKVDEVCAKVHGYETVLAGDVIEIRNANYGVEQGYYGDMKKAKAYWDALPEA